MPIHYEKKVRVAKLLSPLNDFKLDEHNVEYRIDPLIGHLTLCPSSQEKKIGIINKKTDYGLVEIICEKTEEKCFFCPDKIDFATPKFPSEIFSEGRLKVGESVVFPNLFPYLEHSAVVTLSNCHYLGLNDFEPKILFNAFKGALTYLRRIHEIDPAAKYAVLGANYMFTSGSSIIHPHLQITVGEYPFQYLKSLLDNSYRYYKENSTNYWSDLIKEEKKTDRYIGQSDGIHWIVPFAPIGNYNIQGIIEKSNFIELNERDLEEFANSISNILKFYKNQGQSSFNFCFYSAPLGEEEEYFWLNFSIIRRPNINKIYINDMWFIPRLMMGNIVSMRPEDLANKFKRFLNKKAK
ncbi:MAG: hypothetical protein ACTSRG_08215 [Candidatus Helarchaeota archaeon]